MPAYIVLGFLLFAMYLTYRSACRGWKSLMLIETINENLYQGAWHFVEFLASGFGAVFMGLILWSIASESVFVRLCESQGLWPHLTVVGLWFTAMIVGLVQGYVTYGHPAVHALRAKPKLFG